MITLNVPASHYYRFFMFLGKKEATNFQLITRDIDVCLNENKDITVKIDANEPAFIDLFGKDKLSNYTFTPKTLQILDKNVKYT